jgi:hypothetical protein
MRRVVPTVLCSVVLMAASGAAPASAKRIVERNCDVFGHTTVCAELWSTELPGFLNEIKARAYIAGGRTYITAVHVRKNCCERLAYARAGWLSVGQVKDTPWIFRNCSGADYHAVVGVDHFGFPGTVWSHPGPGQGAC